eukprot:Selendium_serpulae@DN8062_c0_g1_i1.p2
MASGGECGAAVPVPPQEERVDEEALTDWVAMSHVVLDATLALLCSMRPFSVPRAAALLHTLVERLAATAGPDFALLSADAASVGMSLTSMALARLLFAAFDDPMSLSFAARVCREALAALPDTPH